MARHPDHVRYDIWIDKTVKNAFLVIANEEGLDIAQVVWMALQDCIEKNPPNRSNRLI